MRTVESSDLGATMIFRLYLIGCPFSNFYSQINFYVNYDAC